MAQRKWSNKMISCTSPLASDWFGQSTLSNMHHKYNKNQSIILHIFSDFQKKNFLSNWAISLIFSIFRATANHSGRSWCMPTIVFLKAVLGVRHYRPPWLDDGDHDQPLVIKGQINKSWKMPSTRIELLTWDSHAHNMLTTTPEPCIILGKQNASYASCTTLIYMFLSP